MQAGEHEPAATTANGQTPPGRAADEPAVASVGAEPAALTSATVADVEQELQTALAQAAEAQERYLRAMAEVENTRRRAQEDIAKASKYAIEAFAESLVPVIDSLEKALETANASPEAMREGVQITLRQLKAAFERARLVEIDPVGQKFDPHNHQAIAMVPAEAAGGTAPNHVVAVLQKGWRIADRVLRPAMVTVAQA